MFGDGTHTEKLLNNLQNVTTAEEKITTLRFVKMLLISTIKKDSIDDNEKNEKKAAMLIDVNTDMLLQTAECIVSNQEKQKHIEVKSAAGSRLSKDLPLRCCKGIFKTRCDYQTELCH